MDSTPHDSSVAYGAVKGSKRFRKLAVSVFLAFALGLVLAFYLAWSTGWLAEPSAPANADAAAVEAAPNADAELTAAAPLPPVPAGEMTVAMRLGDLERRLNRLDMQAEAASGNAARAEGLLVAFAARRLVERGAPLGYLENQLQLRFGNAQPNAVRTIINSARNPVTLDQLRQGLQSLPETAVTESEDLTGWARIKAEIANLFVLRRADAPSPQPVVRLERAQQLLNDGRVEAAAALVERLPNREATGEWLENAQRYVATQQALDLIETAALLEPRNLSDSQGQPVRQPSPAAPAANAAENPAETAATPAATPVAATRR
ncbi:hypothetical protein [Croceicoccus marinus]|uniref:Uncharacterized protein n=1 Tax=Croceicoccus marinus TaxID=450378 RepID=A0A7G6VQJ8_9SPHN|nr:hypothetical protein [Croceicoccus marinus]QNE04013.1 hypothetical protein H4O24_08240 [Croceicoccus marinus]